VSWKILAHIGNEVIMTNLCWDHEKKKLGKEEYEWKNNLRGIEKG